MKIYAYRAPRGNLGDDLNHWLWPRILNPDFLARPGVFMGIGSVIHPDHFRRLPPEQPLYVFGAGCRSARNPLENTDIEAHLAMVRGPLSARALGLSLDKAGLDAAYVIQFTDEYDSWRALPKKHNVTLIPYFRSGSLVHYPLIKQIKKWNVLRSDHYGSIAQAMQTIASSRCVLTESLHGAILADALRVPWMRLVYYLERPQERETGQFKWKDWQESLNIPCIPTLKIPLEPHYWLSGKKNMVLKPWRTLRYWQYLKIKDSFVLSPESNWRAASQKLKEQLNALQR